MHVVFNWMQLCAILYSWELICSDSLAENLHWQNFRERNLKPATHLAILYADRGEFDRQLAIFATDWCGHTWRFFFADRGDVAVLKTHVIKSPDLMGWLYWRFAANKRRKSRERAHLANAGEFNRRYPTCQISAIWNTDQWKSQSLHRAHLAIFADRYDRPIKSPSVSLALLPEYMSCCWFSDKMLTGLFFLRTFNDVGICSSENKRIRFSAFESFRRPFVEQNVSFASQFNPTFWAHKQISFGRIFTD